MTEKKKRILGVIWALGIVIIASFLIYSLTYLMSFLINKDEEGDKKGDNIHVNMFAEYQFVGFMDEGVLVKDTSGVGYICNETCKEIVSFETGILRGSGKYFVYSGIIGGSSPKEMYNYYQGVFVSTIDGRVVSLPNELFSDVIVWDDKLSLITYKEIASSSENISDIKVYSIGDTELSLIDEFSIQLEVTGDTLNTNVFYTVFPREPIAYYRNDSNVQTLPYTDDYALINETLCLVSSSERKISCNKTTTELPSFMDSSVHEDKLFLLSNGEQADVTEQLINDLKVVSVSLPATDSAVLFCVEDKCVVQDRNLLTVIKF